MAPRGAAVCGAAAVERTAVADMRGASSGAAEPGLKCPEEVSGGRRLRQFRDEAGAAGRVGRVQASTVAYGDVAGDGQAQTGAAVAAIAGLVDAREPFENPFPVGFRDAGAVVVGPPLERGRARVP